jgi:hypothetical protein
MIRRLVFLPIIFILFQASSISASSEMQSGRALEIQAAFLVKFCSYVTWPEERFSTPESPVIVGIIGRDPFGSKIDKIARSSRAGERNIEIRRCTDISSVGRVHILFIAPSETDRLQKIVSDIPANSVLLVSNIPGFLESSGMVNFVVVSQKIRFNISRTNSENAGLMISSKLLSVAHEIQ